MPVSPVIDGNKRADSVGNSVAVNQDYGPSTFLWGPEEYCPLGNSNLGQGRAREKMAPTARTSDDDVGTFSAVGIGS